MTRLEWSACENVRDLGGLPAAGGKVRERVLVRADSLTRLDDAGLAALRSYGVRRVVDLRAEAETASPAHPFAGTETYVNVPWVDVPIDGEASLENFYLGSLAVNTDQVATVVRAFADAPDGPVVVHCAVGKDRTGIVTALLLSLAGVPRQQIVADYVISETALGLEALFATLDAEQRVRAERFARSAPETIEAFLDHLDAEYGGTESYLRASCGLTDDELDRARQRLVQP
jgi:protein tyrosine/serine phosphatase